MGSRLETSIGHAGGSRGLGQLKAAFEAHRRSGSSRVIPEELRRGVVAAVEAGAPAGEVCRVCRVSWGQLSRWRGSRGEAASNREEQVRVLSVVEPARATGLSGGREIEVRFGGIRLVIIQSEDME
jgi:hypothetical protein